MFSRCKYKDKNVCSENHSHYTRVKKRHLTIWCMAGNQRLAEGDGNPVLHGDFRSQGVEIRRVDFQVMAVEGFATGVGQPGPEEPPENPGQGAYGAVE